MLLLLLSPFAEADGVNAAVVVVAPEDNRLNRRSQEFTDPHGKSVIELYYLQSISSDKQMNNLATEGPSSP